MLKHVLYYRTYGSSFAIILQNPFDLTQTVLLPNCFFQTKTLASTLRLNDLSYYDGDSKLCATKQLLCN